MSEPVFTDLTAEKAAKWGSEPMQLAHSLHRHPLFSMETLATLIDGYPGPEYDLIATGEQGSKRQQWDEGRLGDEVKGADVIRWIAEGRLWLNLRRLHMVRPQYGTIIEQAFGEISRAVPGLDLFNPAIGLLISSPGAQVYCHADLPGQMLFQIAGRKRVYIYPNTPPYLRPEFLEDIAASGEENDLPYEPGWDRAATVFDLEPGQMLHWPLNAPHRVENLGVMNISMTAEYWTDEIVRRHKVNLANGIARHRLGIPLKGRALSGPSYWAKSVFQGVLRRTSIVKKAKAARKPFLFTLDGSAPGRTRPVDGPVVHQTIPVR